MGKTIQIRVDESLKEILEKIRSDVAFDLKKRYNLNEVTIDGTLTSKILAARFRGQNLFSFTIRKTGLNKGTIELI